MREVRDYVPNPMLPSTIQRFEKSEGSSRDPALLPCAQSWISRSFNREYYNILIQGRSISFDLMLGTSLDSIGLGNYIMLILICSLLLSLSKVS